MKLGYPVILKNMKNHFFPTYGHNVLYIVPIDRKKVIFLVF